MAKSSVSARNSKGTKPENPADFPLFPHGNGYWAKKIRGKLHYFGRWDDPEGALAAYDAVKEDLHAGRTPKQDQDGLTVRQLCNGFIKSKRIDLDAAKLSPRTFVDYDRVCKRIVDTFGHSRAVNDLRPADFEQLYGLLARRYSLNTQCGEITMTRSVFKYAYESDLIEKPVKFGPKFKVPKKADRRKAKAKAKRSNGNRHFSAEEIRAMLNNATPQLRAMILLGINCGLGNTDCANLPIDAVDLKRGWVDFARVKTGVERRCPLWPETVEALRAVLKSRKEPQDEADADLLFITKYGQKWVRYELEEKKVRGKKTVRPKQDDAIAKATAKVLRKLGINRRGVGFYGLRHSFETAAGGSRDQVTVDAIMGHIDPSMAAEYRHDIQEERLQAVVDHVHAWLFGSEMEGGSDE